MGGITRAIILELARHEGIKVEERIFSLEELKNADEIFITSTTKDILPIASVDSITVGQKERVGEITAQLMDLFSGHINKQIATEKVA